MLITLIINFRTAEATIHCLEALLPELPAQSRIYLLDNGSGDNEAERLNSYSSQHPSIISFEAVPKNLGFAQGMNLLLERALADPKVDRILLLNSDTRPTQGFLTSMQAQLNPATRTEMIAARLLRPEDGSIESLGLTLYRSTLVSNRTLETNILLGPTGGCALFSRRLLEDLYATHGEWFDPQFFCYAEDADLVLRARWLGYLPAYAPDALVYHIGSLSSGGANNDFVLYHGIRNSLWWLVKNAPLGWFVCSLPWFIALHAGIWLRHLRQGRVTVLWRLYRDALKGLPSLLKKRAIIRSTRRVPANKFRDWVEPRFYESTYLRNAWRELWQLR